MDALVVDKTDSQETYPIEVAIWNLYLDKSLKKPVLSLHVETGRSLVSDQDTWWEVNLVQEGLRTPLASGSLFSMPNGYDESSDENLTNFYWWSVHDKTDKNVIQVLEVDGDRLLLRMQGQTIYETFHEEAGTRHTYATVTVVTWFDRDSNQTRSF